jgi:elongation factor G
VDDGDTVTDYMVQERERGITITSAAITFPWNDYRINLIDTPGHVDFTVEVERSVRVLDGAVAIFDAVTGVEAQSKTVWKQADRYGVPRIAYINKMDKTGANVHYCIQTMVDKLTCKPFLVQLPIGEENNFKGIVDLITLQEYQWVMSDKGKTYNHSPISEKHSLYKEVVEYRQKLIESMADVDEVFADLYLSGSEISQKDFHACLKRITLSKLGVVILCGSSFKNKGVQLLMDAICDYLPCPSERPLSTAKNLKGENVVIPLDINGIFCALAFKVTFHPHLGQLVFIRVYGGTLKAKQAVYNSSKSKTEKISKIFQMNANVPQEIQSVSAGNIAVLVGCTESSTGDTIMLESRRSNPLILDGVRIPKPVFFCSIEPDSTSQQELLERALSQLQKEDPTFQVSTSVETGQMLISGMGELHLEIIADRLKREFKVACSTGPVQISYRETMLHTTTETYSHEKTINGRTFLSSLTLRIKPSPRGSGNVFSMENLVANDCEPTWEVIKDLGEYIQHGVISALSRGSVLGFPMEDLTVEVLGASVESGCKPEMNQIGIQTCAQYLLSNLFERNLQSGQNKLLEPVMKVEVRTDNNYLGIVLNDLSSGKRGHIKELGFENGENVVNAEVPLSSLVGYSSYVRSLTSGNAHFYMEFSKYDEVTSSEQIKILKKMRGF